MAVVQFVGNGVKCFLRLSCETYENTGVHVLERIFGHDGCTKDLAHADVFILIGIVIFEIFLHGASIQAKEGGL